MPTKFYFNTIVLLILSMTVHAQANLAQIRNMQSTPNIYAALKTSDIITIDGKEEEEIWTQTAWSDSFIDIEGSTKEKPPYNTQFKMAWDANNLYIYAKMEEPHVWGSLTQRDAIIYHDNDFEIFIKPRRNLTSYYEIEINALNTIMDLILHKPYRLGGEAIMHWDVKGLKSAIHIEGSLNNPKDTDHFWSVEMAIPFSSLNTFGQKPTPNINDYWQINFSRVQWQHEIIDGTYNRKKENKKPIKEDNWVWSPIGIVNMHYPERWGYIQFVANKEIASTLPKEYRIEKTAWNIFYLQKHHYNIQKKYTQDITKLDDYANILKEDFKQIKHQILTNQEKTYFKVTLIDIQNKLKMTIDSFGNYHLSDE